MTDHSVPALPSHDAVLLFDAITQAANLADLGVLITHSNPDESGLTLLYWNESVERMTGRSREEILEKGGLFPFLSPEQRALISELNAARVRGDSLPSRFCAELQHQSGRQVPVDITLVPITLSDQPLTVAFVLDLTQQQQAEVALKRTQALFQQVVAIAPDGIFILRWPHVLFSNPAGARIFDCETPEQVIGLNVLERLAAEPTPVIEAPARRGAAASSPAPQRYRGRNPNGREFAIEMTTSPIVFQGDAAVLAFARDVTERDAMASLLLEAHNQAAVSVLAEGVAHEINNPLGYMLLNLESFARDLLELDASARVERMRARLAETRQGAERVKTIVRELQALTRNDAEIRGPVELDQIIMRALGTAKRELPQRSRVLTDFHPVPCVFGNPTRLEQLVLHLIVNAAHALANVAEGEIRIALGLSPDHPGDVLVDVTDNGCGMSEEVLARAFDPFFTTKQLGIGTGLGLAICKRIVHDLGGSIALQSGPGRGTTVIVRLPGAQPSAEPPPAAPAARRGA